MKTIVIAWVHKSRNRVLALAGLLLLSFGAVAQDDSATAATAEAAEMISPAIDFTCIQKADNSIDLKAALKAKINGSFYKLHTLKVTFVQLNGEEEKELGFVITDRNGVAVFNCKAEALTPDKDGKVHFKAVFAGNKSMDPAEEELGVKRARLSITPVKEDSLLSVQLKLVDITTGEEKPLAETDLGVFVKRSFNPLKIGEGTTDENGEISVEVPNNLPGDAKGNITLTGRLDDNEEYGNLEASVLQQWGVPVSDQPQSMPRALWSSDPPLWMLITFIVLMTVVWGHYFVIIYELFRLRKEKEPEATKL